MRFAHRWFTNSTAQAAFETAVVLPICLYAFFFLMELSLSLYSATLVKDSAEHALQFVQSESLGEAQATLGSGVDSSTITSMVEPFVRAYFAQRSMNMIGSDSPNACVSWWQAGEAGPFHYTQCTSGSGVGSYGEGTADPDSPQAGEMVAVQVTWRYNPWISHIFPVSPTFTYTAVGPVIY